MKSEIMLKMTWLLPTGRVKWINSYFIYVMGYAVFVRKERIKRDVIDRGICLRKKKES